MLSAQDWRDLVALGPKPPWWRPWRRKRWMLALLELKARVLERNARELAAQFWQTWQRDQSVRPEVN